MTTSASRLQRLLRAYPSLNLRIEVDKEQHEAHVTLPGLRYDDIDYTGQPSVWRLLNTIGRAEHAAFYSAHPYLKYNQLHQEGIGTFSAELTMEFGRHFYEVTTPKSPLHVRLNVIGIADTSFTSCMSLMVGGRLKPSVQVKSLNILRHRDSGLTETVPHWWRSHFTGYLPRFPEKPAVPRPPKRMGPTFEHHLVVPFNDTDTSGHTRHPMYLRYLFDNMSIAFDRFQYRRLRGDLGDFKVRKLSLLSYGSSRFGDALTVETFEDLEEEEGEIKLHCCISKNGALQWYGCVEFFLPDAVK